MKLKEEKLPKGWQLKKLEDIGHIISGGTPSTVIDDYWNGEIAWITPADLSNYEGKFINKGRKNITELGLKKSSARLMPKGSILFSSRAPIGYTVIASNEVSTNQGFKSIIPGKTVLSDYVYYYLSSSKQKAEDVANGTTFKEISLKAFSQLTIPIPPIAEQQAIVAKIEELISELENGKQQLITAQQQLKVYRQSLLKWAFEGKELLPFEEFVESSQNGLSKRTGTMGQEYKVLRLADINKNIIDNTSPRKITMDENEISKYKIKVDDLICIRVNGSKDLVGKLIHITCQNESDNWAFCDHFIRFRLNPRKALSKFFHLYFSTVKIRKYIHENMVTSAGQNTVSQGTIKNALVPNCPLNEQLFIVSELERKLTACEKIEETISKSLQHTETLKQSILKKAFEGRLV